jgi:hypothetical protein
MAIELIQETDSLLVFQSKTEPRSATDGCIIGILVAPIIFLSLILFTGSLVGITSYLLEELSSILPPFFNETIAPIIALTIGMISTSLWFYFWFVWLRRRLKCTAWIFNRASGTISKKPWIGIGDATYLFKDIQSVNLTCQPLFPDNEYGSDTEYAMDNTMYLWELKLIRVKHRPVVICLLRAVTEDRLHDSLTTAMHKIQHFLRS